MRLPLHLGGNRPSRWIVIASADGRVRSGHARHGGLPLVVLVEHLLIRVLPGEPLMLIGGFLCFVSQGVVVSLVRFPLHLNLN